MTKPSIIIFALAAALAVTGCDRHPEKAHSAGAADAGAPIPNTKTPETRKLATTINVFERTPNAETSAQVKKAFADLESEIAELQVDVAKSSGGPREEAAAKQRNLESYRDAEQLRFAKAQAAAGFSDQPVADTPVGDAVDDKARRAGEAIGDAARKAGSAIKEGADKIGEAVKDGAR